MGASCPACDDGACDHRAEGPSACMGVRGPLVLGDVGECSCQLVAEPLRGLAVEGVVAAAAAAAVGVAAAFVEAGHRMGWESPGVEFGVDSGGRPAGVVTKSVRDRQLN